MRRFIAILLLSFLSIQSVWAAVAAYGEHEMQHLAYHAHEHAQHAAADVDLGTGDPAAAASVTGDVDCGHCHCSFASIFQRSAMTAGTVPNLHPRPPRELTSGAYASARPERPQWLCLA